MTLELTDDLLKRIEYFAAIFKQTPMEYLSTLLERIVPPIPNQADAVQHLQDILEGKYALPGEGDEELDEYVRRLNDSRVKLPVDRMSVVGSTKS